MHICICVHVYIRICSLQRLDLRTRVCVCLSIYLWNLCSAPSR